MALARAADPEPPSAALRQRILATLTARKVETRHGGAALVVLDMINEHLTPGMPLEVPRAREIVPALQERLSRARAGGVPVVYIVDEHDPDDVDMDGVEGWGAHAVRGSEGTEVWSELAPQEGDRVIKKATYSAFTGSELGRVLDDLQIDTIELTGCLTELGMLATATDALQRGFVVEVPRDETQAGSHEMSSSSGVSARGPLAIMPPYGQRVARLASKAQL